MKNWVLPNSRFHRPHPGLFRKIYVAADFFQGFQCFTVEPWGLGKFHVQLIRGLMQRKAWPVPDLYLTCALFENSETRAVSSHIVPHCSCLAALLMVHWFFLLITLQNIHSNIIRLYDSKLKTVIETCIEIFWSSALLLQTWSKSYNGFFVGFEAMSMHFISLQVLHTKATNQTIWWPNSLWSYYGSLSNLQSTQCPKPPITLRPQLKWLHAQPECQNVGGHWLKSFQMLRLGRRNHMNFMLVSKCN